ncbi:hypothetical protein F8M41_017393 [Gigaspora margarita]|uniref:Uncharacterized protein n=1 Tax=Gigaspora margarita TaxID=4874 RepID=A0A8H4EM49_GIGMA|nr:hypothetical protein F8M41_017393 [Gigaspora margarita]
MCSGNLESIKFNSDGKAKITRSFTQKNLRNKKIQPYSDIIDIPTNSDTSITIIYNQVPTGQQQLAIVNSKLHSVFGYGERLKYQNENDKNYCLALLFVLQNCNFVDNYPVDTWLKKAANTFGKEVEQLGNFSLVQESSSLAVQFEKRANSKNSRQVKKQQIIKVVKWEKVADALRSSGVGVINSIDRYVATNERNNNIEFADNLNSIRIAYDSFKKLVEQSPLRGNKSKPIRFKKANNMPLGEKAISKSKRGWIAKQMQSILNIDASTERKTWAALKFVNQLLSERLVTLESLIFDSENSEDSNNDSGLERENDNYKVIEDNETHVLDIELDDTDAIEF